MPFICRKQKKGGFKAMSEGRIETIGVFARRKSIVRYAGDSVARLSWTIRTPGLPGRPGLIGTRKLAGGRRS